MDFEKIYKMNEWEEGTPNWNEKTIIKNSFFRKRDFWEQEPEIANAVSKIVLGSPFVSENDDDLDITID